MPDALLSKESLIYGFNILLLMSLFIGVVIGSWSKKRKVKFAEYANIPLEDSDPQPSTTDPQQRAQ